MIFGVWQRWLVFAIIAALFLAQLPFQRRFMRDPRANAIFYNASGTVLLLCQTNDLELESHGEILKAICASVELEDE